MRLKGPSINVTVVIPSESGIVPARGIFSATVPITPEIRAFLADSVDQRAWTRQAVSEPVSWTVVDAAIHDHGRTSET